MSLVRQITITDQTSLPPTPPLTPSSDESEFSTRTRLLRRVAKSHTRHSRPRRTSEGAISITRDKPLPHIPTNVKSYSDRRTIMNDMCIGFPKRPRQQSNNQSHPSLETIATLPDGLHKASIRLQKDMLPCIDWAGVSVKVGLFSVLSPFVLIWISLLFSSIIWMFLYYLDQTNSEPEFQYGYFS